MKLGKIFRKGFCATIAASIFVVACGWDPSRPFDRESPEVKEAIGWLDAGDAHVASTVLENYLATGECKEGNIGTPSKVHERSNGSFDLGIALFDIAQTYGRRFGDEEVDAGHGEDPTKALRSAQVECALRVTRAIAEDRDQPLDLRARARYLEGNLHFLNANYEEAVRAYDAALELAPGMHDGGPIGAGDGGGKYAPDAVGRDAAWNRAIALRRIEDKKDAGKDAESDASNDGGGDGGNGDKNDDKTDAGNKNEDAGKDSGGNDDKNDKKDPPPKNDEKQPPPPPTSRQNQDERMLDQLENAPTVQQEAAKKQAQKRRVRGMADK